MKDPNRLSFYTSSYFLIPFCFLASMGVAVMSFAHNIYHDSQYGEIGFGSYDMCQQKALTDIAQKHGLGFKIMHYDEFPSVFVTGKKDVIAKINQEYEKLYPPTTGEVGYATTQPPKQCHLSNVKNNVPNINAKLVPYIPNDVDYVSYSPSEDKAVYCYYNFAIDGGDVDKTAKRGSQCSFIQITKDVYGKQELESYDISDMERANLDHLSEFWNNKKQVADYYGAHSYVTKWENSPTHYFGFNLATPYSGNRWGGYGEY